jgi:SAM-dependent methyltransferase
MSKIISDINKFIDSLKFDKHRSFRKEIYGLLKKADKDKYDYGNGYFYQSLEKINLSGLRNSKKRLSEYNLSKLTLNSEILDIGCNSAFLICELEQNFKSYFGIEWNNNLIEIGNKTIKYLNLQNIDLIDGNFLNYNFNNRKFGVIFSFANHSTYDKGIISSTDYFNKCDSLLIKNGTLVVESHHPNYENKITFEKMINKLIKSYSYKQIVKKIIKSNNFYDNGRTFIILKK